VITEEPGYLYAEFETRWLRFVDDVEFLLDAPAGVIHVRSASRLGRKDLGVNRKRIEELRARHDGLMVAVIPTCEISPRVREAFFADAADWHANAAETSLMLHLFPELVRAVAIPSADDPDRTGGLEFAHPVNRTSTNGVTGSPSLGTREDGRLLFKWMVDDLAARVSAGLTETPPLAAGWRPNL
jgi:creatinine amidohydrolase